MRTVWAALILASAPICGSAQTPSAAPTVGPPAIMGMSRPLPTGNPELDAFRQGFFEANENRCDLAVKHFTNALSYSVKNVDYLNRRAQCYSRLGLIDKALLDYDLILEIEPKSYRGYASRGSLKLHAGNVDGAIEDYNQAILLGGQSRILADRATAWEKKGDLKKALEDLNQAIALDPRYAFNYFLSRAVVHYRLGNWSAALQDGEGAVEHGQGLAFAHYVVGVAKIKLGRTSEGEVDLAKARQLSAGIDTVGEARGLRR